MSTTVEDARAFVGSNTGLLTGIACFLAGEGLALHTLGQHLNNYTQPSLQRSITRILTLVPFLGISAFVKFMSGSEDSVEMHIITLLSEFMEAFSIYCFLTLFLSYCGGENACVSEISVKPGSLSHFFPISLFSKEIDCDENFVKRCKQMALQFVILKPVIGIVNLSFYLSNRQMSTIMNFVDVAFYNISYSIALYGLVLFYEATRFHSGVKDRNPSPLLQMIAVKGVVFLLYWQDFWLAIFLPGAPKLSHYLLLVELPLMAVMHKWAFSVHDFVLLPGTGNINEISSKHPYFHTNNITNSTSNAVTKIGTQKNYMPPNCRLENFSYDLDAYDEDIDYSQRSNGQNTKSNSNKTPKKSKNNKKHQEQNHKNCIVISDENSSYDEHISPKIVAAETDSYPYEASPKEDDLFFISQDNPFEDNIGLMDEASSFHTKFQHQQTDSDEIVLMGDNSNNQENSKLKGLATKLFKNLKDTISIGDVVDDTIFNFSNKYKGRLALNDGSQFFNDSPSNTLTNSNKLMNLHKTDLFALAPKPLTESFANNHNANNNSTTINNNNHNSNVNGDNEPFMAFQVTVPLTERFVGIDKNKTHIPKCLEEKINEQQQQQEKDDEVNPTETNHSSDNQQLENDPIESEIADCVDEAEKTDKNTPIVDEQEIDNPIPIVQEEEVVDGQTENQNEDNTHIHQLNSDDPIENADSHDSTTTQKQAHLTANVDHAVHVETSQKED